MATQDLTIEQSGGGVLPRIAVPLVGVAIAVGLGALAVYNPLIALALAGGVLLAVAIIVSPDVATLAVVAILYTNAAAVAVKVHGLPATGGYAFPILLIAPLAYMLVVRRQPIVITPAFPWILGFFAANILGTIMAIDPSSAFTELRSLLFEGVGLYFLITNVVRTTDLLRKVVWVVVLSATFLSCLSIYQQVTKTYDNNYGGFSQVGLNEGFTVSSDGIRTESQRRSGGPFETGGDNRYAQVLLVAVPLALFLLMAERRLLLRILAGVCLAAIAVATVYTFSRGGAITLVALTLLAVLLRFIRLRALAVIVLGVAILLIAVPSYWVRISTLSELPGTTSPADSGTQAPDGSIVSRGTENLAAILIFADHPAVGVGPGLYPQYYREYADRLGDYSNQIDIKLKNADRQAHTLYLGILAENGILGFVAIMGAIVVTLLHLNRVRRRCQREKPELALLASGFILSIIGLPDHRPVPPPRLRAVLLPDPRARRLRERDPRPRGGRRGSGSRGHAVAPLLLAPAPAPRATPQAGRGRPAGRRLSSAHEP